MTEFCPSCKAADSCKLYARNSNTEADLQARIDRFQTALGKRFNKPDFSHIQSSIEATTASIEEARGRHATEIKGFRCYRP